MNKITGVQLNTIQNNNIKYTNPELKKEMNQNQQIINRLNQVQEEVNKALMECIKVIKNEPIAKEELKLIKSKYPEILQLANKYSKEVKEFKNVGAKINNINKLQILLETTKKSINKEFESKQAINIEVTMKKTTIDEVVKIYEQRKSDIKKLDNIINKLLNLKTLDKVEINYLKDNYKNVRLDRINNYIRSIQPLEKQLKSIDYKVKDEMIRRELDIVKNTLEKKIISKEEYNIKELILLKISTDQYEKGYIPVENRNIYKKDQYDYAQKNLFYFISPLRYILQDKEIDKKIFIVIAIIIAINVILRL